MVATFPGGGSIAQSVVEVETALTAEVRETLEVTPGRPVHRFVPAATLAQGQVVYYTLRVRNPAPVPALDVVVVQRVPANTVYVEGSASGPGADISFSVDGGQTFARAGDLNVVEPDGSSRRAAAGDYTHIRWRLRNPLAPGATAFTRFRAVFQ